MGKEVLVRKFIQKYYLNLNINKDFYFPMIAFNHEQVKSNVSGSYIIAKWSQFNSIAERIHEMDTEVLKNISNKLSSGETFRPESEAEKQCFKLIEDLDHVTTFTKGSITSKKHIHNEIWSLISLKGSPSWFITLSPADSRHPICLYFAGPAGKFKHKILSSTERDKLIMKNPTAAAHFFFIL
ncbi:hypothetical protein FA15DRAFT_598952 [Coprinopsis marcescibilis]|uniref:Helitron helicase-like domain-containing protein n=1 Tax=Coprinopsis marcescibilis TaxID=230819 RepID=A0A5C3KLQ4_COPMA|nr:hypothetical protein FA15DRAFT_598952 [Coprinopsis marcescibilis]